MPEIARDNHFIPQSYSKGWASEGKVWRYHLLAPSNDSPTWEHIPVKRFGQFRDLYTSVRAGDESDEDERWLNEDVEEPAAEPLRKLRSDKPLTREEWRRITRYLLVLRYRTPASYHEDTARWEKTLAPVLNRTMKGAERRLKKFARRPSASMRRQAPLPDEAPLVRVKFEPAGDDSKVLVHAEVRIDRELWLHQLRRVATRLFAKLPDYSWCVDRPHAGWSWFTSDHPVFVLRYKNADEYDFEGGWKLKKADIMVPISPQHLLHAAVGMDQPASRVLTGEQTLEIQRMVAARAFRSILAHQPTQRPVLMRPRLVDLEEYNREQGIRTRWHQVQRDGVLDAEE